ncbi:hypothetical protein D3C72_2528260 [compost metagenome]
MLSDIPPTASSRVSASNTMDSKALPNCVLKFSTTEPASSSKELRLFSAEASQRVQ